MAQILATADIGSNTIHLLVAMASKKRFRRLVNDSEWLSLGEMVQRRGEISPDAIRQVIQVLTRFQGEAKRLGADGLYVFGTEAMRKARNHDDLLAQIKAQTGIQVDLIDPRREAELGLRGALLDSDPVMPAVFAEAGGGSLQVAEYDGAGMGREWSLPLGTGALMARVNLTIPSTPAQLSDLERTIQQAFDRADLPAFAPRLLCCGGVARGLWRAMHPDGQRELHWRELDHLVWDTSRLTTSLISQRYQVKPKRAETLLPGAVLFRSLMERLSVTTMEVSAYGVREGAIAEMLEGRLSPVLT